MSNTGHNYNVERQTVLEGLIGSLVQQLAKLAPHPDRPDISGPLFIDHQGFFHPPVNHNSLFHCDFTGAAANNSTPISGSMGTSALQNSFTRSALLGQIMQAYHSDLPRRLRLESQLSSYIRRLYSRRRNALRCAPLMAA